jgi:hypothetical protein
MHITFPDTISDDIISLAVGSDVYTLAKGTVSERDIYVTCTEDIPNAPNMHNECNELVDWNILQPENDERTVGIRKSWCVYSKNGTIFGSVVYTCEELENYTGVHKCIDIQTSILPDFRGQGLLKYIGYLGDYVAHHDGNSCVNTEFSVIDSSNKVLKDSKNRNNKWLYLDDSKYTEVSHRFQSTPTIVTEYWAKQGITKSMFSVTKRKTALTDAKWQTPLVKKHIARQNLKNWDDSSRFPS